MVIAVWLVVGLVLGLVANTVVLPRTTAGTLATMAVALVGALVGGALFDMALGVADPNVWSPLAAAAGAAALLAVLAGARTHAR